jgi:hypothetical protein
VLPASEPYTEGHLDESLIGEPRVPSRRARVSVPEVRLERALEHAAQVRVGGERVLRAS